MKNHLTVCVLAVVGSECTLIEGSGRPCAGQFELYSKAGPLVIPDLPPEVSSFPTLQVTTWRGTGTVNRFDAPDQPLDRSDAPGEFTFSVDCADGDLFPCGHAPYPSEAGCYYDHATMEFTLLAPEDWPTELQSWPVIDYRYVAAENNGDAACLWNAWCLTVYY